VRVPCMRPGGQRDITANPNPADAACRVQTSVSHEQCSDYVIIRKCLGTAAFPLYVQESFCTWNESVPSSLSAPSRWRASSSSPKIHSFVHGLLSPDLYTPGLTTDPLRPTPLGPRPSASVSH
jgi:hypothetical protein